MAKLKSRIFAIKAGKPLNVKDLKAIASNRVFNAKETTIVDSDLSESYASRIFSDIAVIDFSNVYAAKPAKDATKAEQAEFETARKAAIANLAHLEFVEGEKTWVCFASTPSEKKQGKNILVLKEEHHLLHEDLGLTDELLDGTSYAKVEDKLIANCFSGQHEGSIAKAGLGMKNIFIGASRAKGTAWEHAVKAMNLQNLSTTGELEGKVYDGELTNKVGDAQGIVIQEALPEYRTAFISLARKLDPEAAAEMAANNVVAAIKTAYWHGTLSRINNMIHNLATQGKLDLFWMEQCRGKGMKCTIVDLPVVAKCVELGINKLDGFFGEVKALTELISENKIVLVTEDCLKASKLWNTAEKWNAWVEKGYERILCCDNGHVSCKKGEAKNWVNTARQQLCPIVGAEQEEIDGIAARTHESLKDVFENGSEETKVLAHIFGDEAKTSVAASYLDTGRMLSERNLAEQGKVRVPGAWGMIQWDPMPMLGVWAHIDNEDERPELIKKLRTVFGDTIVFNAKANEKVGAIGRFPSLGMNLLFVKIERNIQLCDNAIFMSWDLFANDVLKADTDGDHCIVYLPESDEERDEILAYMG